MKISTFKNQSHLDSSLIDAVINQFGGKQAFKESANDVANHGIDGGFGGFIYHADTVKFAEDNKTSIMELAEEQARDFGYDSEISMIQGFNCLNGAYNESEIAEAIYNDTDDSTQVLNALAWYAAEEVCRSYTDLSE